MQKDEQETVLEVKAYFIMLIRDWLLSSVGPAQSTNSAEAQSQWRKVWTLSFYYNIIIWTSFCLKEKICNCTVSMSLLRTGWHTLNAVKFLRSYYVILLYDHMFMFMQHVVR